MHYVTVDPVENLERSHSKDFDEILCKITTLLRSDTYRVNADYTSDHCVKSVPIRSFSYPYFAAFGLNTEKYRVSEK